MTLARPDAVLFDLDGTLVDSLPTLAGVMNDILVDLDRAPVSRETVRSFVGDGVARLVERALLATGGLPRAGLDAVTADFVARYEEAPAAGTLLREGCLEALDALAARGLPLGVCTNKPERVTRLLLRDLGLADRFGTIVGGDSCATRKPSPEPVHEACRPLGVEAARAGFVGDNEHDVAAARAAGCLWVVLVLGGYSRVPLGELGADAIVATLDAIPHLIEA